MCFFLFYKELEIKPFFWYSTSILLDVILRALEFFWKSFEFVLLAFLSTYVVCKKIIFLDTYSKSNFWITPVGINEKGFVNSDFGMFLLLDYCIENEMGSVGTPLCRVLINISSKSSKIVYFSQNCYFHVM